MKKSLFLLLFGGGCFFDCGLCGSQTGDRHTEWGATDIRQSDAMTELHTGRFTAMFASNAELDVRACLAAEFGRHLHQFTNAVLVDGSKRILLHDFQLLVTGQE